jgi:glycosyltransferase involved in cell wall biosynthesis
MGSDLLILPTLYEALGLVVMEAMACGLPVLISRIAGAADIVRLPECLIDSPTDADEIAGKLMYFIGDRNGCRQIGVELHEKVGQYNWKDISEKIMAVYKESLR